MASGYSHLDLLHDKDFFQPLHSLPTDETSAGKYLDNLDRTAAKISHPAATLMRLSISTVAGWDGGNKIMYAPKYYPLYCLNIVFKFKPNPLLH